MYGQSGGVPQNPSPQARSRFAASAHYMHPSRANTYEHIIPEGSGALTPWRLGIGAPSGAGSGGREVTIDSQGRKASIWGLYCNVADVNNAVKMFLNHVIKNGLDIEVQVGGKSWKLDDREDENKHYVRQMLLPNIRQMLRDWLLYGYTRVRISHPPESPLPIFSVLREGSTEEKFYWDEYDRRCYTMHYAGSSKNASGDAEIPGGRLLFMHPPDDEGNLTSPMAMCLMPLMYGMRLWYYFMSAAFGQSHPMPFWTADDNTSSNNMTSYGPLSVHGAAEHGLTGGQASAEKALQDAVHSQIEAAALAASYNNSQQQQNYPTYDAFGGISSTGGGGGGGASGVVNTSLPSEIREAEKQDPMRDAQRSRIAAPGHRIQMPPPYTTPQQFLEIQHMISQQVYRAIGIPPEMVGSSHQKHAANVEDNAEQLSTRILFFQRHASELIEELIAEMWEEVIHTHIMEDAIEKKKDTDVQYLKKQRESVKVSVNFRFNPIMPFEGLSNLYNTGIIDFDTYQKYALYSYGIPQDEGQKDGEEALFKREKRAAEMAAAAKPAPAGSSSAASKKKPTSAAAGGGGAKRKASSSASKTAATSSSSRKKSKE